MRQHCSDQETDQEDFQKLLKDGGIRMSRTNELSRYYRNKYFITIPDNFTIEPGSLWREEAGVMILVDEDEYVCFTPYNPDDFEESPPNDHPH